MMSSCVVRQGQLKFKHRKKMQENYSTGDTVTLRL